MPLAKLSTGRPPRVLRKGNFKGGQPRYPSLPAAVWSRVKIGGEDECWPWTAGIASHGYGNFSWESRVVTSHVAAFMISKGPVPVGLHVLHTCDNKRCCNPKHLYAGTHAQNMRDARERGRGYVFGKAEAHPRAKLTAQDVAAIRRIRAKEGRKPNLDLELAQKYGVDRSSISNIWNGRTWRTG